jgi:MFS family permease
MVLEKRKLPSEARKVDRLDRGKARLLEIETDQGRDMTVSKQTPSRIRLFYSWYILAASFAILFFTSGARYSFGVAFKPMIKELDWTRGAFSLAFFLNMTLFAFSLIAAGRLYDRYGAKWVIVISTIFLSGGFALISLVNSLWQFYIVYGVFAALGLGGTSIPLLAALISKWFTTWRGLAISLALAGNCMGQFVLIPVFTFSTLRYGWRISYLSIGLMMLLVNMALVLFVIKESADHHDTTSLRVKREEKKETREEIASSDHLQDLSLGEAMKTSPFWLFLVVMFVCGSGDFLVTTHLIPFVTDHGIHPAQAGNMLAWIGLMSLFGVLMAGPASDLIGNRVPMAIAFLLRFGAFLLILTHESSTSFYIFSIVFGFTYLVTGPLATTLLGRLYGFSHIGILSGFVTTVHHIGGGLWAYLGGVVFDQTGSYRWAFICSAIMAFIAFLCCILIRERRHIRFRKSSPQ